MRREKKNPAENLGGEKYPAHQVAKKKLADQKTAHKDEHFKFVYARLVTELAENW